MNKKLFINLNITQEELLKKLNLSEFRYTKILKELGFQNISTDGQKTNHLFSLDILEKVAKYLKYDIEIEYSIEEEFEKYKKYNLIDKKAPKVTIMGHVNHGKTSLVDYLTKTNIVAGEAGKITQIVSSKKFTYKDNDLILIDTPGHNAFIDLRKLVIEMSDIIILLIAADEGILEQTEEILKHIMHKPKIVCISKIDKGIHNLESIYQNLCKYNCIVDSYGGDVIVSKISSKTGEGIDELLNNIFLLSDDLNLRAEINNHAIGKILDSYNYDGMGNFTNILLNSGTINLNDNFICLGSNGQNYMGLVKKILRDKKNSKFANCNDFIEIAGLETKLPTGSMFLTGKESYLKKFMSISLKNENKKIEESKYKFILKCTNICQLDTFINHLSMLGNVVSSSIGELSDFDFDLAKKSNLIVLLWGNYSKKLLQKLKDEKITYFNSQIIYEIIENVKDYINKLEVKIVYKEVGIAEIRKIFTVKRGTVAGCVVAEGTIDQKNLCYVRRGNDNIMLCKIVSMQRGPDVISESRSGTECGLFLHSIEKYIQDDYKIGDKIISLIEDLK